MGVGTAIATAVGIGGQVYSGSQASKAAKKSAKAAGKLYGPYISAGQMAIGKLARGDFGEETPEYAFRLKEQRKALNRRLARLGKMDSGQAIGEDLGLTQRLSGEETGRQESRLFNIAQMGLSAAGGGASAEMARGGAESGFWGGMGEMAGGIPGFWESVRGRLYDKKKKSTNPADPYGIDQIQNTGVSDPYGLYTSEFVLPDLR